MRRTQLIAALLLLASTAAAQGGGDPPAGRGGRGGGRGGAPQPGRVTPDTPRPIEAGTSLWAEELTFMEVRDLVKAGTTTIIIGTGIVLIGDSGGNQNGMRNVADTLNKLWSADPNTKARVHFLPEYYTEDQWSWDYLKSLGYVQIDTLAATPEQRNRRADTRNGMHDDIYYEAQIAVQNPELVRVSQRLKLGKLTLHGVDLVSADKLVEIGKQLAEYRAGITARALDASRKKLRP